MISLLLINDCGAALRRGASGCWTGEANLKTTARNRKDEAKKALNEIKSAE